MDGEGDEDIEEGGKEVLGGTEDDHDDHEEVDKAAATRTASSENRTWAGPLTLTLSIGRATFTPLFLGRYSGGFAMEPSRSHHLLRRHDSE